MIQSYMKIMKISEPKKVWSMLFIIALIAFTVRFVAISSFPLGFNADEASFGYDAYSLATTAKDQWGNFLPFTLKSFGDYKSPLYSYLAIPFIYLFGLNIASVRVVSVFVGVLSVLASYLLFTKILPGRTKEALLVALLVALNPWSVMMGRGAFEFNLLTATIPLAIYFFLKGQEKPSAYTLSAIFFGISLLTYHSAKVIVPALIVVLCFIYRKRFNKKFANSLLPLTVFSVFAGATIYALVIGGGSRISERSITQGALEEGAKAKIELIQHGTNPSIAKFLHNKYQVVLTRFINNYLQYFSPRFLVTQGAGESYYGMIPGIGVLGILEIVLLVFSLFFFIKKPLTKESLLVVLWILVTPIPSALSTGVGYAGNRASGMIPVLQIIEGLGLAYLLDLVGPKKRKLAIIVWVVAFVLVIFSTCVFVKKYFFGSKGEPYKQMLYGNLEVSEWLLKNKGPRKVFISRSLSEPQIFLAFSGRWNPSDYQKYAIGWDLSGSKVSWVDQIGEYNLGEFTIKSIDWEREGKTKGNVVVFRASELPKEVTPDKTFYYPDGKPNIYVKVN